MTELTIKPVRYGIIIGLLGLLLGISWAFWLVLGHERIHRSLEKSFVERKEVHMDMMNEGQQMMQPGEDKHQHGEGMHDSPIMELAHKRLVRGHLHLMGLGLVSVVVSLILSFTGAPPLFKTVTSVLMGIGGIVYPAAWIVMGYMSPRLGADGAEAYVTLIAGPGVLLVTFGLFSTIIFLLKDIFSEK